MKSLLKFLIYTFLTVFGLFLIAESLLWTLFPSKKRAQFSLNVSNEIPGLKKDVSLVFDDKYLRTWSPESKAGQPFHILCLGSSSTSTILQNDADTWWGQMGQGLSKEFPGLHITVSGIGADMPTISHVASWMQTYFAEQTCDLVVALYSPNDLLTKPLEHSYDPQAIEKIIAPGQEAKSIKSQIKNTLNLFSQCFRRYNIARQKRSINQRLQPLTEPNYYLNELIRKRQLYSRLPVKYDLKRENEQNLYQEYLDATTLIAKMASERNVPLILVGESTLHSGLIIGTPAEYLLNRPMSIKSEPSLDSNQNFFRPDPAAFETELSRYYDAIAALAEKKNLTFLNLQRKIRPTTENFVDEVTYTDAGSREMASLLMATVKKAISSAIKK